MTQGTLRQLIGQVVMFGFHGRSLSESPELERWVAEGRMANVILMARNIVDAAHAAKLTAEIQECAGWRRGGSEGLPALIAADQEGGVVVRVSRGATVFAGNMALGAAALGGTDLAYDVGVATGTELRHMGINVNLAPVLDVNSNPDNPGIGVRSFGSDPDLVASLGERTVRGLQDAGVASTAKHFPGKGDVCLDSHLTLPVIRHPLERLRSCEFIPFERAIRAGVRVVMSSHASYAALGSGPHPGAAGAGGGAGPAPGTLSAGVMTGLLRGQMGFRGVAITDDLEMGAITQGYGVAEAAVVAFNAGADILLVCHTPDRQRAVLEGLEQAVASGMVPESRLREAVSRVAELKSWLAAAGTARGARRAGAGRRARWPEDHDGLRAELARAAVAVVCDRDRVLPLAPHPGRPVVVVAPAPPAQARPLVGVEEPIPAKEVAAGGTAAGGPVPHTALGSAVARRCPWAREVVVAVDPSSAEAEAALAEVRSSSDSGGHALLVIGTYNAHLRRNQLSLARDLLRGRAPGARALVVALRNPYDLGEIARGEGGGNAALIAVFNYDEACCEAGVGVAFGELPARGRVPVAVGRPAPLD